jgi:predicted dehydrogenase
MNSSHPVREGPVERLRTLPSLRGAIIGYGLIAERAHAVAYARRAGSPRDVEIVAVADPSEERRALARLQIPGVRVYADHAQLFAAEQGAIDFADIATPPTDHAAITHAALNQGLHVLCETPFATSVADARSMLRHALDVERVIFPCHSYQYAPVIKEVRALLDDGRIGKVHLVTLHAFRETHDPGASEWRPHWRREWRYSGGGIAMDHGSHAFCLAFEWLKSYPKSISACAAPAAGFDTEDDFSCSLIFPTGVATAHLSWRAGVRKTIYTIHGDRGAIRVEDDRIEVATHAPAQIDRPAERQLDERRSDLWVFDRREIRSDWTDSSHVEWFTSLFDEFTTAIARRDFVGREARDGLCCVQVITTGYASASQASRELAVDERLSAKADDIGTSERETVES